MPTPFQTGCWFSQPMEKEREREEGKKRITLNCRLLILYRIWRKRCLTEESKKTNGVVNRAHWQAFKCWSKLTFYCRWLKQSDKTSFTLGFRSRWPLKVQRCAVLARCDTAMNFCRPRKRNHIAPTAGVYWLSRANGRKCDASTVNHVHLIMISYLNGQKYARFNGRLHTVCVHGAPEHFILFNF